MEEEDNRDVELEVARVFLNPFQKHIISHLTEISVRCEITLVVFIVLFLCLPFHFFSLLLFPCNSFCISIFLFYFNFFYKALIMISVIDF